MKKWLNYFFDCFLNCNKVQHKTEKRKKKKHKTQNRNVELYDTYFFCTMKTSLVLINMLQND